MKDKLKAPEKTIFSIIFILLVIGSHRGICQSLNRFNYFTKEISAFEFLSEIFNGLKWVGLR